MSHADAETGSIRISTLSKAYKQYSSRWARLVEWSFPFLGCQHQPIWVLRDINITVSSGQALGIIGVNGAGKSTLLKIVTGTTQPTTGEVRMSGRIAALLELGMGFHPEFTGRQNCYMAGQLLGLRVEEITALMPDIEAFAEIGDYIDQPVRVYSSGMQVRLAFSVATAVRPDILIIDEALSVGDTYFQHKSFERIRQFRKHGTTLLFVSHEKSVVQSLCDRAILLDQGRVARDGNPEEVLDFYNALIADQKNNRVETTALQNGKVQTISGTGEAKIVDLVLRDAQGQAIEVVSVGQQVTLEILVNVYDNLPELVVGFLIKDRLGQFVFGTNTHHMKKKLVQVASGEKITYRFHFPASFGVGSYSIAVALHTQDTHLVANYEWRDLALVFQIVNISQVPFVGVCWVQPQVEIQR